MSINVSNITVLENDDGEEIYANREHFIEVIAVLGFLSDELKSSNDGVKINGDTCIPARGMQEALNVLTAIMEEL
tara:strand:- start:218 stop:442 length:225 start_codon:yes stop_codon:yes gene_type:complete